LKNQSVQIDFIIHI